MYSIDGRNPVDPDQQRGQQQQDLTLYLDSTPQVLTEADYLLIDAMAASLGANLNFLDEFLVEWRAKGNRRAFLQALQLAWMETQIAGYKLRMAGELLQQKEEIRHRFTLQNMANRAQELSKLGQLNRQLYIESFAAFIETAKELLHLMQEAGIDDEPLQLMVDRFRLMISEADAMAAFSSQVE